PAPLTIDFTDTSSDPDGAIQTRSWDFGDGSGASATNPTHTYGSPGVYTVTLQVTDDDGLTDSAASTVTVVAGLALTLDGEVLDGGFLDGRRLGGEVELRLYQADGTTPLPFVDGLGPDANGIAVAGGEIEATVAVELTGTGVVASVGETRPGLAVERIGFEVVPGATQHTQTLTFAPSGTAIRGRVTDTRMEPAAVDIGVARSDIATLYPVATGRDYLPGSGFPATGVLHRVVSDPLGLYYIPVRDGGRYYLDVVGDTGGSDYLSTLLDFPVTPGEAADQDITVGLQSGGAACDDLSALPETPNVDYATQIQPLWSFACTGCHKPNSANGGGLDLTPANSYAALVNVASTQVPGLDLVAPGRPEESYLLEKIRCDNPQVGNRMRQGDPMDPAEQALVRDWIAQGAPMTGRPPDAGMPDLGPEDSGGADAAPPDGGTGGSPEVGAPDAGIGDAGVPARDVGGSAGAEAEDVTGGCVCAPAPSGGPGVIIGVLAGALVLVPRLRRRRPDERSKGPGSALR
ncbi:MAG TPA: PKD domain-containing protein, partial [Polyangiaceae bacterium LLY-WYZ-14_1]|nr:PKD domain-containing protein [Polyangiaceae bacterium LLY-WYZ-14_1]